MRKVLLVTSALALLGQAPLSAQGRKNPRISDRLWDVVHGVQPVVGGPPLQTQTGPPAVPVQPAVAPAENGTVVISVIAEDDTDALASQLEALGAGDIAQAGRVVSARLPVEAIPNLAGLDQVRYARASLAVLNVGRVTSQGDPAMAADLARASLGLTGAGRKVGILSDSFDYLGGMQAGIGSGDLPSDIQILLDGTGADEGRAMGEIVHDVAPGAALAFRTATLGEADFAQGILDLHTAGCQVIVDDVLYLNEPMFADGIIAQAVDQVTAAGVAYFSAAGNAGLNDYTAPFRLSSNGCHDFDPGTGTDTILNFEYYPTTTWFILQWTDRYASAGHGNPGAATDLDIEFLDVNGNPVNGIGGFDANVGGDPIEVFGISVPWDVKYWPGRAGLRVRLKTGPPPAMLKLVWYTTWAAGPVEYRSPVSTVYGHMNARGAMATGAVSYCNTPAYGVVIPVVESYSSQGGTPIYFAPDGTPAYELRQKPDFCAPTAVDNTFFGSDSDCGTTTGFPNFAGTSAAAPHAAAVAALMLEARPTTTPSRIRTLLQETAINMAAPGFDFRTGYGLVQANPAIQKLMLPPTAQELEVKTTQDRPIAITLAGSDPNGFPISFELVSVPTQGLLSGLAPDLVYAPTPGYTGEDSFTFQVCNSYCTSDPVTVRLTVVPPPVLQGVVSRMTHGAAGTFDIQLPPQSPFGVECRSGSNVSLVFTFDRAVAHAAPVVRNGVATVAASTINGTQVRVDLSEVSNAQWLKVELTDITTTDGAYLAAAPVTFTKFIADVTNNRYITSADVTAVKNAVGYYVHSGNFRCDVSANGYLTSADVTATKAEVGALLPPLSF